MLYWMRKHGWIPWTKQDVLRFLNHAVCHHMCTSTNDLTSSMTVACLRNAWVAVEYEVSYQHARMRLFA